jgi:cell division septation protein DedD
VQAGASASETETISDDVEQPLAQSEPASPQEPADAMTPAQPANQKQVKIAPKRKPAVKTAVVKKKPTKPLVLVPSEASEATEISASSGTNVLYGDTASQNAPAAPEVQAPAKRRTLADLLNGRSSEAQAQPQAETRVAAAKPAAPRRALIQQQPAEALQDTQQSAPAARVGGGGFVAQFASFKSQAEASREFSRMQGRHPSILGGLSPVVNEVTVAGSKRYRLAVGPMGSRATASQLCSRLIQAGERDCVPKRL